MAPIRCKKAVTSVKLFAVKPADSAVETYSCHANTNQESQHEFELLR